MKIPL